MGLGVFCDFMVCVKADTAGVGWHSGFTVVAAFSIMETKTTGVKDAPSEMIRISSDVIVGAVHTRLFLVRAAEERPSESPASK